MKNLSYKTYEFLTGNRQIRFWQVFLSAIFVLGVFIIATAGVAEAQDNLIKAKASENAFAGVWIAEFKPDKPDKIDVKFKRQSTKEGFSSTTNPFLIGELQGLTPQSTFSGKTSVNFRIAREAGTFECEGFLDKGKGGGSWKLIINPDFISSMRRRGYDRLTENDLFDAALQNVNSGLIEELKSAGYENLSFNDLVEARIFNITPEFIEKQKTAGYKGLTFKELVEIRQFGKISAKSR
jgi:hypothetical protein